MKLSTVERTVLRELVQRHGDAEDGRVHLQPDHETQGAFEEAIKRLERGAYIVIEERFGRNNAVLRLTPRGEKLWIEEVIGGEYGECEITLEEMPTWDDPPVETGFVQYDELEPGDQFKDKRGRKWEVPKQVEDPDPVREVLNRTAIDFQRGTSAVVPKGTFVQKADD